MSEYEVEPGSDQAVTESDIESYLDSGKPKKWYKRKRVWAATALLLLLILVIASSFGEDSPPSYATAEVERRALNLTVTATGNLRPTNQVEVGSEISGRVDRVLVDVNDKVVRGQVIAVINTDVIRDQINLNQANLRSAVAQVQQAKAGLDADAAQLKRLREVERLSGGRVPSATEMEQAVAAVRRGEAAVAAAQASVTATRAQLSTAQTQLERAIIRAPVSGVVLARQIEPGQTVAASFNTPTLFVLAENLATMQLRVELDEADISQVKVGQQATFVVDAYPGRRFPARIERVNLAATNIAQQAQQQGQAQQVVRYEARLIVDNPELLLRPGMTATATIATQKEENALLVPNAAIRFRPETESGGGAFFGEADIGLGEQQKTSIGIGSRQRVYVVEEDGELRAIDVVTGRSDGRVTIVKSKDLKVGMKVATGLQSETP